MHNFKIGDMIRRKKDDLNDGWWRGYFNGSKKAFRVVKSPRMAGGMRIINDSGNGYWPAPTSMELVDDGFEEHRKRLINA